MPTVDSDLEVKTFAHAGKILAKNLLSNLSLDGYPVVANYVSSSTQMTPTEVSEEWRTLHVRESRYMLQIVKWQT